MKMNSGSGMLQQTVRRVRHDTTLRFRQLSSSSSSSPSVTSKDTLAAPSRWDALFEQAQTVYNQKSGYHEIKKLKDKVVEKSHAFDVASQQATKARQDLDAILTEQASIHSRHSNLLRTRDAWTAQDATEFASIVGKEVEIKQQLAQARQQLQEADTALQQTQYAYMDAVRQRYHEEQIWQDYWRIISTYGTWSLIVLNTVVFLASQFFHRRREAMRIKAIETLINEKIPDNLLQDDLQQVAAERREREEKAEIAVDRSNEASMTENAETKITEPLEGASALALKEKDATTIKNKEEEQKLDSSPEQVAWYTRPLKVVGSFASEAYNGVHGLVVPHDTTPSATDDSTLHPSVIKSREFLQHAVADLSKRILALSVSARQQAHRIMGDDFHVPSAMVGATVSGVTVALVFTLMSMGGGQRK